MGPGLNPRSARQDIVATDIDGATKDAEVARLREELQQCNTKLAHSKASLMSTLDELDAQRDVHRLEIKAERSAKDKLSKKLDLYLEDVKRAEKERDDMREVVSILLEKVERSNDYSAWPCPRMALPRPLEILPDREDGSGALNTGENGKDTSYIALVGLLQKQLAYERHAHARTKEEAVAEILMLKAMVARRDAELEACATHSGHQMLLSSLASRDALLPMPCTRSNCPHGREHNAMVLGTWCNCCTNVAENETVTTGTVLPQIASRNRALEREVELLRRSVEEVRNSGPYRVGSSKAASGKPTAPGHVSVGVQVSTPIHPAGDDHYLPSSPSLLPVTVPSSPTPFTLTPSYGAVQVQDDDIALLAYGASYHSNRPPNAVKGLEQDINRLASEIDGFVIARKQLKKTVSRGPSQSAPGITSKPFRPTTDTAVHSDNEHTRAQQELREQLHAITRERARREQELEAEITSLRQALLDLSHHQPAPPPPLQEGEDDDARALEAGKTGESEVVEGPLGQGTLPPHQRLGVRPPPELPESADELGEQSMELATPLQTTILSLREEDWPLPPAHIPNGALVPPSNPEPAEVPLPLSPDCEPVPATLLPSPLHRPATPHPPADISPPLIVAPPHAPPDLLARLESATEARVSSLERELAATQRELEEREAALANLQTTAAHQDSHPSARPPSDTPGTGSDAA